MNHARARLGPPLLWLLGAVGFLTAFGAHAVVVNLPAYSRVYGLDYGAIGFLLAAYNLAEIFAKPFAGKMADRLGPRPVMAWGTVFFSLACLAYLACPATALPGLRICQGIGAGALSVGSTILVTRLYRHRLGIALGVYNALKGVGYVCAPLAGSILGRGADLRGVFLAAGAAGLLALMWQLAAGRGLTLPPLPATRRPGRQSGQWPWYMANFLDMALLGILLGFLPMRAAGLGLGTGAIGGVLTAAMCAYLLAQPVAGFLADRSGRRPFILGGLAFAALALASLGMVRGAAFYALVPIAGGALGATWTNSLARVGEGARGESIGNDLGWAGSCKDLGDILGPLACGLLADWTGLPAAFAWCSAAVLLLAAVVAAATRSDRGQTAAAQAVKC